MTYPEFARWPSIMRLSSETVYITEKIDGTNAVIYVPEDASAPVLAGRKEGWLSSPAGHPPATGDNFGFGAWVAEHANELRAMGPGYHYGEWHGLKIQRQYGLTERRFASFEFWRDDLPTIITKVPLLYAGSWTPTLFDDQIQRLIGCGSVLYPGFMDPEGIVISFEEMRCAKFKKFCKKDDVRKWQQKGKA